MDNVIDIELLDYDDLNVVLEEESECEVEGSVTFASATDHRKLTHRDAEGQHPIEAIDNLREELEELQDEAISNTELQEFFRSR